MDSIGFSKNMFVQNKLTVTRRDEGWGHWKKGNGRYRLPIIE